MSKVVLSQSLVNDEGTREVTIQIGGDVPEHQIRFVVVRTEHSDERPYQSLLDSLSMRSFMDTNFSWETLTGHLDRELDSEFKEEVLHEAAQMILLWDSNYEEVNFDPQRQ